MNYISFIKSKFLTSRNIIAIVLIEKLQHKAKYKKPYRYAILGVAPKG